MIKKIKPVKDLQLERDENKIKFKWELHSQTLIAELSNENTPIPLVEKYHYVKNHCTKLLSIDGTRVYIPAGEIKDEDIALKGGKLIKSTEIILKPGEPHECHSNSARYWKRNKNTCKLVTGYALCSDDWLSHSWILTKKNRIIDSTIKADKYYGVILNNTQAEQFCKKILQQN
ncbi:MAG: hypothetical protein WCZ90_12880 [Melioribacteraceae bacterium]